MQGKRVATCCSKHIKCFNCQREQNKLCHKSGSCWSTWQKKHHIGLHEQETIVSGCFRPMLLLHTKNCILSSTHHRDLHTSHIPSEQVSIFGVNVAFSGQSQKCKCPFLHQYQTRIPPSGVPRVDSVAILLYLQRFNS